MAFWYVDDPRVGTRWHETLAVWRVDDTNSYVFPCPDGRILVLFMGPAEDIPRFRADPDGMWNAMMAQFPTLAGRVGDAPNRGKPRTTDDTVSFFRASSRPGWALAGDAGHFKDPVLGQGQYDALRYGRLLGERAAGVVDSEHKLDRVLRQWERDRDLDCLPVYYWGNRETRIDQPWPILAEAWRFLMALRLGGFRPVGPACAENPGWVWPPAERRAAVSEAAERADPTPPDEQSHPSARSDGHRPAHTS